MGKNIKILVCAHKDSRLPQHEYFCPIQVGASLTSARFFPVLDNTGDNMVKLANTRQRIRPGMFGRVTVSFGTLRHVVVPAQAIVKRAGSGDRYVYVYKDGKVSYNKVELGRRMGTEYELISGVEDNSQVVVAGQTRLADGVEVAVN